MIESEITTNNTNATHLGRKSWVVYVMLFVFNLIFAVVVFGIAFLFKDFAYFTIVITVLSILWLIRLIYLFLYLRSFRLYCDDIGVWMYAGILPWDKGTSGVKWRDIDAASYSLSIFNWLFNTYTVRIGHRFTKTGEIVFYGLYGGKKSVALINERHQDYIRTHDHENSTAQASQKSQ